MNPQDKQRELNIEETHALVDIPNWGEIWVIKDIKEYHAKLDLYTQSREREAKKKQGEDIRSKLPEKRATETVAGEPFNLSEYGRGINDTIDQITNLLNSYGE